MSFFQDVQEITCNSKVTYGNTSIVKRSCFHFCDIRHSVRMLSVN
jgi:hypothetical protein